METIFIVNPKAGQGKCSEKLIAKIASQYIEDGDIIALDAGTTVLQLIDYIYDKEYNKLGKARTPTELEGKYFG